MGLSNETYIVHTKYSGDIVVPVENVVTYKNIQLVGYNAYQYHENISQSLVNLNDEIILLKNGPAGQAQLDLEEVIAQAKLDITTQKDELEAALNSALTTSLDKIIKDTTVNNTAMSESIVTIEGNITSLDVSKTEHGNRLETIETQINGKVTSTETTIGIIDKIKTHASEITNIQNSIGKIESINGSTVIAGTGVLGNIELLTRVIGDNNSGILKDNIDMNANIVNISKIVGTSYESTYNLSSDVKDIKTFLFNTPQIPILENTNLMNDVYNDSTGLITKITNIESKINVLDGLSSNSVAQSQSLYTLSNTVDVIESDVTLLKTNSNSNTNRIISIENLGLNALKETVVGTNGLTTIIGSATSGLIKKVNDNVLAINSNNTTLTTSLTTLGNRVTKTEEDIVIIKSDISTINNDINIVEGDISDIVENISDIETNISNMMTTVDTHMTYNSVLYNAQKLSTMDTTLTSYINADILAQFQSYFYNTTTSTYIAKDAIGIETIAKWSDDTTATGMKLKTNNFINTYLSTDPQYGKINTLELSMNTLRGSANTAGSILKGLTDLETDLNLKIETDVNTLSANLSPRVTSLENDNTLNKNKIAALESKDSIMNKAYDEIVNESVKYSTLLPFLKKIFIMINPNTNVSNDNLSLMFDTLINNVSTLSATYVNNGVVTLTKGTNTSLLDYNIVEKNLTYFLLDGDTEAATYRIRFRIIKKLDNSIIEYIELNDTISDPDNYNVSSLIGNRVINHVITNNDFAFFKRTGENTLDDTIYKSLSDIYGYIADTTNYAVESYFDVNVKNSIDFNTVESFTIKLQ